jgi:hypothetical protein
MGLLEHLSEASEEEVYAYVLNSVQRAKTENKGGALFYITLLIGIKEAYLKYIKEDLNTILNTIAVIELHFIGANLIWQVQTLLTEFESKNNAYLADVLLPLLMIEMQEKNMHLSMLTTYIMGKSLEKLFQANPHLFTP